MKIAVASEGRWLDSAISDHTGRAAFFLIYDTDAESFEVLDNWRIHECHHWAGSRTAQVLAKREVGAVLVRRIGPCAFRRFADSRIPVYFAEGDTVVDTIRAYRESGLEPASSPNCAGHEHEG